MGNTASSFRYFLATIFIFSFMLYTNNVWSQVRCGTVEYIQKLKKQGKLLEQDQSFENWLQKKNALRRQRQSLGRTEETIYKIPVVVHIIHNGEPVGIGTNLSDEQIHSQIDVLNKDFQRLNTDASSTPAEFTPVAGSMNIEFILAKQTPEGQTTNGIVRVQGTNASWTENDNSKLKALSYWPAEKYFNIWVCNLTDYLGYTQFPISNLPGLENSSSNRLTDGIVIWYKTFGSKSYGSFTLASRYNLGRTVTHEVGHFFGLRHIWGDNSNCNGTDYVDDTPNQNGNTGGCPSDVRTGCVANEHRMYQNYLDYTDDACMNLFTKDQVERMITVLENSPRRASLLSSLGWKSPDPVPNDLGIKSIITPQENNCSSILFPSIEVKNYGTTIITSSQIQLAVNAVVKETKTFTLNLAPMESTVIDFSSMTADFGISDFNFEILNSNNVTDGDNVNDTMHVSAVFHEPINIPFTESFNFIPANWSIQNLDQLTTWEVTTVPSVVPDNNALLLNFFYYEDQEGEQDVLFTPVLDLSNETRAFLTFDVAYAQFDAGSTDGLKVLALTDCSSELFTAVELYNKSGGTLATTTNTKQYFKPDKKNQWRKEVIDLSQFIGKSNVQLAFVGVNGWGNNLYIDNISVTNEGAFTDLGIDKVISPQIVTCENPEPKLLLQNEGTSGITSFKVKYHVNGGNYLTVDFTGMNIEPGAQQEITLPALSLSQGANAIEFALVTEADINSSNDTVSFNVAFNYATEIIPVRENFNSTFSNQWSLVNPNGGENWKTILTNYDSSIYFNGFDNPQMDDEAWLISPLFDFSNISKASVFFDRSYAYNFKHTAIEQLLVRASIGCGNPFDITLYDESDKLHNGLSSLSWKPSKTEDWKRTYVDLSSLTGQKNVRLAWVIINGHGNNIYLDNFEFFASDNSEAPQITDLFKVYGTSDQSSDFSVTFNLPEAQTVSIDIIDTLGRTRSSNTIQGVLNQTYPFKLQEVNAGLYIVRIKTTAQARATKVYITR